MTADKLAMVVGSVISLLLSYTPGLRVKYQSLSDEWKAFIALAVTIVVAGAIFFLSCYGVIAQVECTKAGAFGLLAVVIEALGGLGTTFVVTHKLTDKPKV